MQRWPASRLRLMQASLLLWSQKLLEKKDYENNIGCREADYQAGNRNY
jgi:hypothetical protein